MNKIHAFGNKLIVERNTKSKESTKEFLVLGNDTYVTGTVINVGYAVPNLFMDNNISLEVGSTIVYSSAQAISLGLDFPDSYDVIEAEDIVGVIQTEEQDG